jgi:inner membrane transporter RhtA
VTAPAAVGSGALGRVDAGVLAACVGLALLVPLLPYSLELLALRRLPARVFGVLMSLEPAIGALLGFLLLEQGLTALGVAAIGMVVVASAGAALSARG